ncbi:hypothetical protein Tco_0268701 [Tanacetum coccineum]
MKNDKVIAPRMFRINPSKTTTEDKFMPINKVRESARTKLITFSQPHVITKKDVNYDLHGLSSTGVDNTTKTRRPQPRSNTKNDRVPSASKSSCIKNKEAENDKSEVVCVMCEQCLITAKHDVHVLNYVNDINSRADNQNAKKFLGTIRFGNDHIAAFLGYGNLKWGHILIIRVYFIEGFGHNLFSVSQFYDSDLEVAFRRNTSLDLCYPNNDHEDIGKLGAKGDIGFFIGYYANSCAYRVSTEGQRRLWKR